MFEALVFSFLIGMERFQYGINERVIADIDWYYTTELFVEYSPLPFMDIYGSVTTDFVKAHGIYYAPFHNRYEIGAVMRFENIEIGVEHMCGHPQVSWRKFAGFQYDEAKQRVWLKVSTP